MAKSSKSSMRRLELSAVLAICGAAALATSALAGPVQVAAATPVSLRGMHFVPNRGQWCDETAVYGLRSRGMEIAFRESSFAMHVQREVLDLNRDLQQTDRSGVENQESGLRSPPTPDH